MSIQEYYEDHQLPIYEHIPMDKKRVYSFENVVRILLNPKLDTSGVLCSKVTTSISGNISFVVDTSKLEHKDADDMGMWKNN